MAVATRKVAIRMQRSRSTLSNGPHGFTFPSSTPPSREDYSGEGGIFISTQHGGVDVRGEIISVPRNLTGPLQPRRAFSLDLQAIGPQQIPRVPDDRLCETKKLSTPPSSAALHINSLHINSDSPTPGVDRSLNALDHKRLRVAPLNLHFSQAPFSRSSICST